MPVSRRKASKIDAPQTLEEAIRQISEYRDILDKVEEIKADAASSMALIETHRDSFIAPLKMRQDTLFIQLRAWWAVASQAVTEGKRKSTVLAGCTIGERTSPPALKLSGITMAALVEALSEIDAVALLRIKEKLNKQAAIAAIGANDELGQLLLWLGAKTVQTEEFFIDRPRKDVEPEMVDTGDAEITGAAA